MGALLNEAEAHELASAVFGCSMPRRRDGDSDARMFVRQILAMARIPVDPPSVQLSPLPLKIAKKVRRLVKPKSCYNNSFHTLSAMLGAGMSDCSYILGYWTPSIPIEHAWVRCGDQWFDPTRELLLDSTNEIYKNSEYFPLIELDMGELLEIINTTRHSCPPALFDVQTACSKLKKEMPWLNPAG